MMYFTFAARVTLSVAATLLGLVVVPVALLRGGVSNPLPVWARPWNNDVEPFGDTARKPAIDAATGFKKGWLRFVWLALRNPANNLSDVLAVSREDGDTIARTGNQLTSDQGQEGTKFNTLVRADGTKAGFEYYYVKQYLPGLCLRIRLGWKLETAIENDARSLVHTITPFKKFGKPT